MLADRRYCYPVTVTDHASRYLLLCEAMESNAEKTAFTAFERLFKEGVYPRRSAPTTASPSPPAELYSSSCRPYQGISGTPRSVPRQNGRRYHCGRLCLYRKKINLSTCLAGQAVGVKQVDDGIWLVSFMHYDLGYIDLEEKTLQPLNNPFGPKVLPMS
jgi:hypothetical protein